MSNHTPAQRDSVSRDAGRHCPGTAGHPIERDLSRPVVPVPLYVLPGELHGLPPDRSDGTLPCPKDSNHGGAPEPLIPSSTRLWLLLPCESVSVGESFLPPLARARAEKLQETEKLTETHTLTPDDPDALPF
jgi:hypothetical protein